MFNRRGVVSIATFSLIILILILILAFSYKYYDDSKLETNLLIKKQELQYSLGSFRSEIINIISYDNSTLNYTSNLDSQSIIIKLTNNTLFAEEIYKGQKVSASISGLGIEFCNNYTFYPSSQTVFMFNDSCISIVS